MKTRVIALVLAVCMMLGLCAFASAHGPGNCTCADPSPYYYRCNAGGTHVYCMTCGNDIAVYCNEHSL